MSICYCLAMHLRRRVRAEGLVGWFVGHVAPRLLTLWFSTIRFRWQGGAFTDPDPRRRGSAIYVFWHQRLLCFVYTHRARGGHVLISRSREGELITRMVAALGYSAVRGSSHRGGSAAVRRLLAVAGDGRDIGIMPDGPRGPARKFKAGAVYLASETGLPIILMTVSYRRFWSMRSWDRFQCPWPFTSAVIHVGEPIFIPRSLDAAALECWRLRLEEALETLTAKTDERRADLYRSGRRAGAQHAGA